MFLFGYKWRGELSEADAVSVVHLHSPLGPCSFTFPWYRLLQYTRIQARVIPAVVLAKISYSLKWKMSFSEWHRHTRVFLIGVKPTTFRLVHGMLYHSVVRLKRENVKKKSSLDVFGKARTSYFFHCTFDFRLRLWLVWLQFPLVIVESLHTGHNPEEM